MTDDASPDPSVGSSSPQSAAFNEVVAAVSGFTAAVLRSHLLRISVVVVIVLLLLVPLSMIRGLIAERESRQQDAVEEVTAKWGRAQSVIGPTLIVPYERPWVDHYVMAERSVKYGGLFILLTFATIWLIEVRAGVRVHPIQYLMIGAALGLFYLLELSLSEHVGFVPAYAIASAAVVVMVAAYGAAVLRRSTRAAIVAAVVAALYGFLFTLLRSEDYALLMGSVGLFAILAVIMFVTRNVNWFSLGAPADGDAAPVVGAAPPTEQA